MGCRRSAIEHQQLVADLQDVGTAKPVGSGRGSASSQNEYLGHGVSLSDYLKGSGAVTGL
jgi:hypothetical protein